MDTQFGNVMVLLRKFLVSFVAITFVLTSVVSPAHAQVLYNITPPNVMVPLSSGFVPAMLKGIKIHTEDPFKFDFIVNRGDEALSRDQKEESYTRLIKYFLASLTIPDEDQWVNLSPYEKDRIIKDDFGKTEMGRDLLAQDYLLKQITSSAMFPESALGKAFWTRVYAEVEQKFGTTDVPLDTFNKVWITPDKAMVYEKDNIAYIGQMHLKVQLEDDYQAVKSNAVEKNSELGADSSFEVKSIIRQVILPALEKEVNEGRNFAQLRQIFGGMVLATWYKRALKESLLGRIYADRSRVKGVDQEDPTVNQQIYDRYVEAFKTGVYNYIKEEYDTASQTTIPRKYFSGGIVKDLSNLERQPVASLRGVIPDTDEAVSLTLDPARTKARSTSSLRRTLLAFGLTAMNLLFVVNNSFAAPDKVPETQKLIVAAPKQDKGLKGPDWSNVGGNNVQKFGESSNGTFWWWAQRKEPGWIGLGLTIDINDGVRGALGRGEALSHYEIRMPVGDDVSSEVQITLEDDEKGSNGIGHELTLSVGDAVAKKAVQFEGSDKKRVMVINILNFFANGKKVLDRKESVVHYAPDKDHLDGVYRSETIIYDERFNFPGIQKVKIWVPENAGWDGKGVTGAFGRPVLQEKADNAQASILVRSLIVSIALSLLTGVDSSLAAGDPVLGQAPRIGNATVPVRASIGSAKIVNQMQFDNSTIKNISNVSLAVVQDLDDSNRKALSWEWQSPGGMWTTRSWGTGVPFLDLKKNLDDLVFRFTISGTDGVGYDLAFEDDQGNEIGVSSTEHISVKWSKQYALVRLDKIKDRNQNFNWRAVRPVKFKSVTANGKVLIQNPVILDVSKTRKLGVGVGMFEGNDFPALSGWPSVLSFTGIYNDPQRILEQWRGLRPGQVPHEVLEFDAHPGDGTVLQRINRGEFDQQLIARAKIAKEYGKPVLLRVLHEPMGGWYGWSVRTQEDADNYVAAWQHIVSIYQQNGAKNVAFAFSPHNYEPSNVQQAHPYELADQILSRIQPYVDVIALDAYSYPPGGGNFNELVTGMVSRFEKYGIPFMMGEMSSAMPDKEKREFWTYFLNDLQNGMFPNFVGFVPFDIAKMENGGWKDFHIPTDIKADIQKNPFFARDPFQNLLREKPVASVLSVQGSETSKIASWVSRGGNGIAFTPRPNGQEDVQLRKGNGWGGFGFALSTPGVTSDNFLRYSFTMPLKGDISSVNLIFEDRHKNAQNIGNEIVIAGTQLSSFINNGVLQINLKQLMMTGMRKGDFDISALDQVKIEVVGTGVITIGRPQVTADQAQMNETDVGGIDLNADHLDMTIRRDGAGVALPVEQQNIEGIQIEGLIPVVLDIQPVTRVLKL
ncbi:MAG: hypothetical protein HQL22_11435 [Candidatus Omnitrophica bacterium]|nr:hypothetical protein [Candidatus Omnitrophota bacterium]